MEVRDILKPLRRDDLRRLCDIRNKAVSGTVSELRERLVRSYESEFESVMNDLRKSDLHKIGDSIGERLQLPSGWRELYVEEIREAFTDAASGMASLNEGSVDKYIQLYSSNITTGANSYEVERLEIERLREDAKKAKQATVISAYYDTGTLKELLNACSSDVRVVVNGLGGRRLKAQVKELAKLQKALQGSSRVQIKLSFSGSGDGRRGPFDGAGMAHSVFHPKLYLFKDATGNSVAWLGSANATATGIPSGKDTEEVPYLGHNEEILARVSPAPSAVIKYTKQAWRTARKLEEPLVAPVNSLTAFFRTGTLYYKPHAHLRKAFNPFRPLMAALDPDERAKIPSFSSEYAEQEVGIGSFSIDLAFRKGEIDLAFNLDQRETHLDEQGSTTDGTEPRVYFRPYAVETCYGYWVPEKFVDEVDSMLERASEHKRSELERLHCWLCEHRDYVVNAYKKYLNAAQDWLDSQDVDYPESNWQRIFDDTQRVEREIDVLTDKLSDQNHNHDQLKRLCQAFVSAEMPEFWEDVIARRAFESSFFESLAASSSSERTPIAAATILEAIREDKPAEAATIRAELAKQLAHPGWYDKHFGA